MNKDSTFPAINGDDQITVKSEIVRATGNFSEFLKQFVLPFALVMSIFATALLLSAKPTKMLTVHCTVMPGSSLVDCFGTSKRAFYDSIAFAERYGLPVNATLIGSILKPGDAIKLYGGNGTDVVRVSVNVSPGDEVIVPTDSQGNYVVSKATYIHNGKVVQPVTR